MVLGIKTSLPKEVSIETTADCNLACYWCFNKSARKKHELSTQNIKKIIGKIHGAGVKAVRFTGGEPLLRKDIFELLKYAKSKDLYVMLNTNGTFVDEDAVDKIKGSVDNVLITFNGYDNLSEWKITGSKTSFEKKINAIKLLRKYVKVVRVGTVAVKENIEKLEEFFKILRPLDVNNWEIFRPIPHGAKDLIDNSSVELLVEKLMIFRTCVNAGITNVLPFCSYDPEKVAQVCMGAVNDDGHSKIVIGINGHAKPSYYFEKDLGNLLKEDVMDLWNNSFLKKVRDLKLVPNVCKKCRYLGVCKGGSRYIAKKVNGSYNALDPLARPVKYKDFLL